VDLNDKNKGDTKLATISNKLDFSSEDRIPDQVMNEILWKFVHGEQSQMPVPVRAAFFKEKEEKEDDD
jgi:hypothetical protein